MGQKVNPISFRLETVKNSPEWQSSWFANSRKYPILLLEEEIIFRVPMVTHQKVYLEEQ